MKRYLRKKQLRERYGRDNDRYVERAVKDGRLPKPTMFQGKTPLWDEAILDAHDRRCAVERSNKQDRATAPAA
jgi:hypothetical protein